jgi:Mg2+ and Co2+ transporter CorA
VQWADATVRIESLSIKSVTIAIFVMIGVVAIVLSMLAGAYFRESALDAQINSLSRVLEVATREMQERVRVRSFELGMKLAHSQKLVSAFNEVLAIDEDDREVMSLRDKANELLRAAELLHLDGKMALEFLQAEHAESQVRSTEKLNRIAFRLNLLAGFFLPLVALAGLFGMNVDLPEFVKPMFWAILLGGLVIGLGLLYLVGHKTGSWFDMDDDKKN